MDVNMDCSICYTTMNVAQFDTSRKEEIELSETVFALACGHAFHTNCLCRALRMQTSCPLCRNDEQGVTNVSTGQLRIGPNNEIELTWGSDDDTMEDEVGFSRSRISLERAEKVVTVMNQVAAIPERQHFAARVNKEIKRCRTYENEIIRERRKLLGQSLEELRRTHHKTYIEKRRRVKKALQFLRVNDEKHIRKMDNSEEILQDVNVYRNDLYSVDAIVGVDLGRSFWHLNNS